MHDAMRPRDVAAADFLAQRDQLGLGRTLVHQEDHVDPVQRVDRLEGEVLGIAGADADDQHALHARPSPSYDRGV